MGDSCISLTWDSPYNDGGADITEYRVEGKNIEADEWEVMKVVDGSKYHCSVSGLENDNMYFMRVSAVNKIGKNKIPAELFEPICPKKPVGKLRKLFILKHLIKFSFYFSVKPSAPKNLRASKVTETDVTVEWKHPESDDLGGDVGQYFIDLKEEGELDFIPAGRVGGNISHFTCDFLQRGKLYVFRIKSKNAAGFSDQFAVLNQPVSLKESKGLHKH